MNFEKKTRLSSREISNIISFWKEARRKTDERLPSFWSISFVILVHLFLGFHTDTSRIVLRCLLKHCEERCVSLQICTPSCKFLSPWIWALRRRLSFSFSSSSSSSSSSFFLLFGFVFFFLLFFFSFFFCCSFLFAQIVLLCLNNNNSSDDD